MEFKIMHYLKYNINRMMLEVYDALYKEQCQKELEVQQSKENIAIEQSKTKQLEDQLYTKQRKYKKYRKYTKAIAILYIATFVLTFSIILTLLYR